MHGAAKAHDRRSRMRARLVTPAAALAAAALAYGAGCTSPPQHTVTAVHATAPTQPARVLVATPAQLCAASPACGRWVAGWVHAQQARWYQAAYAAQHPKPRQLPAYAGNYSRERGNGTPPSHTSGTAGTSGGWLVTCYGPRDGFPAGQTTATGAPVGPGSIAVDPHVIPLGSHVTVAGLGSGVANDTGGAVKGHHVDVWEADCGPTWSAHGQVAFG